MRKALILAMTMMTIFVGASTQQGVSANIAGENGLPIDHPTNAAFRDGLYLGGFDAKTAQPAHLATGRWSRELDRVSFNAGYAVGYTLLNRTAITQ